MSSLDVSLSARSASLEALRDEVTPTVTTVSRNTSQTTIRHTSDSETEGPFTCSSDKAETIDTSYVYSLETFDFPPSHSSSPSKDSHMSSATCSSLMNELSETELPVVVYDTKRKLEVHVSDPEAANLRGSEVLKLSMKEYIERLNEKEKKSKVAIKCLRNHVESLQKEVNDVAQSSQIEKDKAVREVRKFWRDSILEGGSRGGRMVKSALQKNRKV